MFEVLVFYKLIQVLPSGIERWTQKKWICHCGLTSDPCMAHIAWWLHCGFFLGHPCFLKAIYCSNWQPWILKSKAKPPSAAMVPKQLPFHLPCLWTMMAASGWSSGQPATNSTNSSLESPKWMHPFPTTLGSKISLPRGMKHGPSWAPCLTQKMMKPMPTPGKKEEWPNRTQAQKLWKCHWMAPSSNVWCKARNQAWVMSWSHWPKSSWNHFLFCSRATRSLWNPGSHTRGQPKNHRPLTCSICLLGKKEFEASLFWHCISMCFGSHIWHFMWGLVWYLA